MKIVERLPYFSFYPADYLLDCADLTLLQHGAYLTLMLRYYWEGSLKVSDKYRSCRTPEDRAAVDMVLTRFFKVNGEAITHNRIEREFAKMGNYVEHQRKAGKASAAARLGKATLGVPYQKGNGAWWKTRDGIEAMGRELNLPPQRGEEMPEYKDRLFAALNAAKAQAQP